VGVAEEDAAGEGASAAVATAGEAEREMVEVGVAGKESLLTVLDAHPLLLAVLSRLSRHLLLLLLLLLALVVGSHVAAASAPLLLQHQALSLPYCYCCCRSQCCYCQCCLRSRVHLLL